MNFKYIQSFEKSTRIGSLIQKVEEDLKEALGSYSSVVQLTTRDHYNLLPQVEIKDILSDRDVLLVYVQDKEIKKARTTIQRKEKTHSLDLETRKTDKGTVKHKIDPEKTSVNELGNLEKENQEHSVNNNALEGGKTTQKERSDFKSKVSTIKKDKERSQASHERDSFEKKISSQEQETTVDKKKKKTSLEDEKMIPFKKRKELKEKVGDSIFK